MHAVQGASKKGEKEEITFSGYTPENGFSFLIIWLVCSDAAGWFCAACVSALFAPHPVSSERVKRAVRHRAISLDLFIMVFLSLTLFESLMLSHFYIIRNFLKSYNNISEEI